jgi:hypothetical protein
MPTNKKPGQWKLTIKQGKKTSSECGMLNFECALPFTIHIHDGSGNFE